MQHVSAYPSWLRGVWQFLMLTHCGFCCCRVVKWRRKWNSIKVKWLQRLLRGTRLSWRWATWKGTWGMYFCESDILFTICKKNLTLVVVSLHTQFWNKPINTVLLKGIAFWQGLRRLSAYKFVRLLPGVKTHHPRSLQLVTDACKHWYMLKMLNISWKRVTEYFALGAGRKGTRKRKENDFKS